jgi:hypothetical protein
MEDKNNISELKAVYDELWADAISLAKDMKSSIAVIWYAGYITVMLAVIILGTAIPPILQVVLGNNDPLNIFEAFFGPFATVILLWFSRKFFKLHKKLRVKYSKLTELEHASGEK